MATGIVSIAAQLRDESRRGCLVRDHRAGVCAIGIADHRLSVQTPAAVSPRSARSRSRSRLLDHRRWELYSGKSVRRIYRSDNGCDWPVGLRNSSLDNFHLRDFLRITVRETDTSLADDINDCWLLIVVATQSVSSLGGLLASHIPLYERQVLFVTVLYLLGAMLYPFSSRSSSIDWRFSRPIRARPHRRIGSIRDRGDYDVSRRDVAGECITLALSGRNSPVYQGFTLFFWAAGTWWIPLLVLWGIWCHVVGDIFSPIREIRCSVLGNSVSARDVHRLYVSIGGDCDTTLPARDSSLFRLFRAACVADDVFQVVAYARYSVR